MFDKRFEYDYDTRPPRIVNTIWLDGPKDPMFCNLCNGRFYREPKKDGIDAMGRSAHHFNGREWGHGVGFVQADIRDGDLCAKCRWEFDRRLDRHSKKRCCDHPDAIYTWDEHQAYLGKIPQKDPRDRTQFQRMQDAIEYLNTSDLVRSYIPGGR